MFLYISSIRAIDFQHRLMSTIVNHEHIGWFACALPCVEMNCVEHAPQLLSDRNVK